jgi:hypothetical protein
VRNSDSRDSDSEGFLLLESRNTIVDSLVSNFAARCWNYSQGVGLGDMDI